MSIEIEILGHNLSEYFKNDEDVEITYKGAKYEVWKINEALFGFMEDQSEEEFKAQAGEDAWWAYPEEHFAMPNTTIVINGCYLNAYNLGDTNWRSDYESLTDYIRSHIGISNSPQGVCRVTASLAEDNDMTLGELFTKCEA